MTDQTLILIGFASVFAIPFVLWLCIIMYEFVTRSSLEHFADKTIGKILPCYEHDDMFFKCFVGIAFLGLIYPCSGFLLGMLVISIVTKVSIWAVITPVLIFVSLFLIRWIVDVCKGLHFNNKTGESERINKLEIDIAKLMNEKKDSDEVDECNTDNDKSKEDSAIIFHGDKVILTCKDTDSSWTGVFVCSDDTNYHIMYSQKESSEAITSYRRSEYTITKM